MTRIDHFRGFDEYYSIPYGETTVVNGRWEKGPGISLFQQVERELGWHEVIAEDLGFVTDSVRRLVQESEDLRNSYAGLPWSGQSQSYEQALYRGYKLAVAASGNRFESGIAAEDQTAFGPLWTFIIASLKNLTGIAEIITWKGFCPRISNQRLRVRFLPTS